MSLCNEKYLKDSKKFLGQAFLGQNGFWKSTEAVPVILSAVRSVSLQA